MDYCIIFSQMMPQALIFKNSLYAFSQLEKYDARYSVLLCTCHVDSTDVPNSRFEEKMKYLNDSCTRIE